MSMLKVHCPVPFVSRRYEFEGEVNRTHLKLTGSPPDLKASALVKLTKVKLLKNYLLRFTES